MLVRIGSLAVKELIQLARDRLMAAFILLFPVAQLLLLAQAAGKGIENLSLAVLDQDRSAQSRALSQVLDNVPELVWRYQPQDETELADLLEQGQAVAAVVIPAGFEESMLGARVPTVQVLVDASNSVPGAAAQSAVEGVITDYVRRQAAGSGGARAPVVLHAAVRYNPQLNSRLYTIPAQMGFIIYQVTLAVASLAFARERELGTLEQLLVTPLRRFELIFGKGALAWLVGLLDFLIMYVVVIKVFNIPMRGSFLLLLALSLLFVAVEIGYGVILSSFARNQQQSILYVFMLAMLDVALSGYLVPVKNMPVPFQVLAAASPLQHFLVIVRAIMLKGAGLEILWPRVVALGLIGIVVGLLALSTATRSLE